MRPSRHLFAFDAFARRARQQARDRRGGIRPRGGGCGRGHACPLNQTSFGDRGARQKDDTGRHHGGSFKKARRLSRRGKIVRAPGYSRRYGGRALQTGHPPLAAEDRRNVRQRNARLFARARRRGVGWRVFGGQRKERHRRFRPV